MKASVPRFTAALLAAGFCLAAGAAGAQDTVVQKDGQKREGTVTGVRAGAVRIKVGPAETGVPLDKVASVDKVAPEAFAKATADWSAGKNAEALAGLQPLAENFKGLPTPWAQRSLSMLAEIYLAEGKTAEADAVLNDFRTFYPESASSLDLLLGELALSRNDISSARQKIEPLAAAARQAKLPGGSDAAVHSQALFLMGRVEEASGDKPRALENYLLVANIFNDDPKSTASAASRAAVLEEEKVLVP